MTADTPHRPVLVGIDGTPSGLEALSLGGALAMAAGAPLVLGAVYGYESMTSTFGAPPWPPRNEVERWLDEAAEQLGDAIPWRAASVCATSIAHGLTRLAEHEDALVLVLGSSRRGAVGRWLIGSGAGHVVHGAPCAVAVVPHGWRIRPPEAPLTFGVAVDSGPEAREAVALAATLARAPHAQVRVFSAVHLLSAAHPLFAATGTSYAGWARECRERALEVAAEAADAIPGAEPQVLDGDPVQSLSEASAELDLLVVGSRRYGPLRSTLLGSVSGGLVEHARCPVLIVPRGIHVAPDAAPDAAATV